MKRNRSIILAVIAAYFLIFAANSFGGKMPKGKEYTNSVGMKFVRVKPGSFQMGVGKTPLPTDVLPIFRGRGLFDMLYKKTKKRQY